MRPDYMVSLLKAFYGDVAQPSNQFGYALLPRIAGDYSFQEMTTMMVDGAIKGLFCLGQNPAVGGQNGRLAREGLGKLDWLVVRDLFEIETAAFWKDAPEITDGETVARSDSDRSFSCCRQQLHPKKMARTPIPSG